MRVKATGLKHQVHIGAMDRKITLIDKVPTRSDSGATTYEDQEIATVWAAVLERTGDEDEEVMKITYVKQRVFVIRYRAVHQTMSIRYYGRDYDIEDIQEIGRRRHLRITATMRE